MSPHLDKETVKQNKGYYTEEKQTLNDNYIDQNSSQQEHSPSKKDPLNQEQIL